jgi:pantoate kinase
LVVLGIFGSGLLIHLPLGAGIALSLALALVTVLMDAAHRLAGERRRVK